jgi:hypothetical protein
MEIINAFNHIIYRFPTSDNYADLLTSLSSLFNSVKLKLSVRPKERIGPVTSTTGLLNNEDMLKLPQMKDLREFVEQCIYSATPEYDNKKIIISHIWANMNGKDSGTKIHRHGNGLAGVCIFYISVPDSGSGNLVIVNEKSSNSDIKINKMLAEYSEQDKIYIPVCTGDVILHSERVYHGITQYKGDIPRIVVVFDYRFE